MNASITSDSPVFELLGKAFSPFPGVVCMPARSQLTTVFNKDGTEHDQDGVLLLYHLNQSVGHRSQAFLI